MIPSTNNINMTLKRLNNCDLLFGVCSRALGYEEIKKPTTPAHVLFHDGEQTQGGFSQVQF